MLRNKLFDEISRKVSAVIAESPAKDVEKNLRAVLHSTFAKLDLVTREEFDIQQAVLLRSREKLERLEDRVAEMERAMHRGDAAAPSTETPPPDSD
ncbi:MAG TPA: phosphoheptose isomerase [Betaproteobacteria bacterium]|nr:phosphoheptose isomerase [Betaproteobacteria bacterium]